MSYDVAILGGGPGGYVAAIRAAQLGAKVCLIEKTRVGGTCLNRGCIPTKTILGSIKVLKHINHAEEFGIKVENISVDLEKIIERKNGIVDNLVSGIEFLLKSYRITLINGKGKLKSKNIIEVILSNGGQESVEATNIILATGSEPANLPAFNIDGQKVITSNEALVLKSIPKRMIIIGAGVIGCEFACILSNLGTEITMIELMPNILPTEDINIARRMAQILKKQGINIKTKVKINKIEKTNNGVIAVLEDGETVEADKALVSIGRTLNTKDIGLEETLVKLTERGAVFVDDYMRTNIDNIYAIGDITGKVMLAHVASAQGLVASSNCLGKSIKMDYNVIPSCIYTFPEIASVGYTEDKARQAGIEVKTGTFNFRALGKAQAIGETDGLVRIIAEEKTDRVLGAQMLGPNVTDLIAEIALAVKNNLTVKQITDTIHAHPTLSEAVLEAAEDVHGMSIHTASQKK
ncbi:MAG: dihydrolipoyl dehydrogenase [Candidatus Firestonebacteria bacterium]|nr:dihydrolipoyl dehydrogenase [Candidatus Firestonebacteria bacterium]